MFVSSNSILEGMTWRFVFGELKELVAEIEKLNIAGIIDEVCDVYTCTMCAISVYTKLNIPIIMNPTITKYNRRKKFFRWYLNKVGLSYDRKYLVNGANYYRGWKRIRIIRLAVQEQYQANLKGINHEEHRSCCYRYNVRGRS